MVQEPTAALLQGFLCDHSQKGRGRMCTIHFTVIWVCLLDRISPQVPPLSLTAVCFPRNREQFVFTILLGVYQ